MSEQPFEQAVRESRIFYRRRLTERLLRDCIQHWRFEDDDPTPMTLEQLAMRAVRLADYATDGLIALEENELRGNPE